MKIINGRELGFMPNGTVFSDIAEPDYEPNTFKGDVTIHGLHILVGHDETLTPESGAFNGVIPMLDFVSCKGTKVLDDLEWYTEWGMVYDTTNGDYAENDWVVVYNKEEIKHIIINLQKAIGEYPVEN